MKYSDDYLEILWEFFQLYYFNEDTRQVFINNSLKMIIRNFFLHTKFFISRSLFCIKLNSCLKVCSIVAFENIFV
jgi:hypothetical protein